MRTTQTRTTTRRTTSTTPRPSRRPTTSSPPAPARRGDRGRRGAPESPQPSLRFPGATPAPACSAAQVRQGGHHATVLVVVGGEVQLGEDVLGVLLHRAGGDH